MHAERIDTLRKSIAVAFAVCGCGLVICENTGHHAVATVFSCGIFTALIAAFGCFVEYLVRLRWERRHGKVAAFQLSLTELMVVIAVVALVLAVFRVLGVATIFVSIAAVILLACAIELVRRPISQARRVSDTGSASLPREERDAKS